MDLNNLTVCEKRKCISEFKAHCYYIYRTYKITSYLFDENANLFKSLKSPLFINDALVDHFLLQLHIITDSAGFGKTDKNLSVSFFLQWSWEPEVRQKLKKLAEKLKKFVCFKPEENPRHKLLAHWDVKTIITNYGKNEALGAFQEGEELEFFNNLEEFIEIMVKEFMLTDDWTILDDSQADEQQLLDIIKAGIASIENCERDVSENESP
jgi:hypothetical protein